MSEYTPEQKAREALNTLIQEAAQWRKIAEANAQQAKNLRQQLHGTRQREGTPLQKESTDGHYIDGHPIEYWHQIAIGTLKTNDELIDRVRELTAIRTKALNLEDQNAILIQCLREKERINADLEQQLKSTEIAAQGVVKDYMDAIGYKGEDNYLAFINHLSRMKHQADCAKTAQDERDAALRELDAMREKLQKADELAGRYCNEALELRRKLQHAERQMDIAHTALLQR